MSDGGQPQRVLDLIDDQNALESFLGGLTSDSELLPSAESVDNVVASLARSLEADYAEVDSPNETLFEALEASNNNLTDISQSYVPSDFENSLSNHQGGYHLGNHQHHHHHHHHHHTLSNGEVLDPQHHHLHQQQQHSMVSSTMEQLLMSTTTSSTSGDGSNSTTHQFNSNCDSSSQQFTIQQNQVQLNQNHQLLLENPHNSSFSYSQELLQKQTIVNQSQQQQQQQHPQQQQILPSLSSNSIQNESSISSFTQSNGNGTGGLTSADAFQIQNKNEIISQINNNSISSSSSEQLTSINCSGSSSGTIIQQPQQYIQSQQATLNQLVSASLGTTTQLIATSTGNMLTAGQAQTNIIQQIQAAQGAQSYITVDQPLLGGAFGSANLALVATGSTGGTPTYAVLPTGTSFLSNAIMTQPQTLQTLTKGPNGTFYQTGGTQLVTTSNVSQVVQGVGSGGGGGSSGSIINTSTSKPKPPPQLLPKPSEGDGSSSSGSPAVSGAAAATAAVSSSQTNSACASEGGQQGVVTQIFQQQQTAQIQSIGNQVVVTSVGNSIIPQQSFAIGGHPGMTVLSQYGQPMLVPSTAQGGLQFIVRQQSPMLTLQTQAGTAAITTQGNTGGKPVVRYVSQVPQTTGYGLQQIQTANGPAWVAVRYPQPTTTTTPTSVPTTQFNQIQTTESFQGVGVAGQSPQTPVAAAAGVAAPATPTTVAVAPHPSTTTVQQPTVDSSNSKSTPKHKAAQETGGSSAPDSSSEPPPPKKPRSRPKPKKKVTLDLEQLLKQSGIMDEDLQDDSFDFFSAPDAPQNGYDSPAPIQQQQHSHMDSSVEENSRSSDTTPLTQPSTASAPSPKKKSAGSRKRKSAEKKRSPSPVPPPPPPPPVPPKSTKSRRKGGSGGGNQKADSKTDSSKSDTPKKLSSLDDISATIDAVANAARSPSPPPPPSTLPAFTFPAPEPVPVNTPKPKTSPASSSIKTCTSPSAPSTQIHHNNSNGPTPQSSPAPALIQNGTIATPSPPNNCNTSNTIQPGTTTRIVQTIQLTPQNQQLLRNIQAQISRLLSLPKRNDTEQTALQKLIVLQQQVISTGIPVPNPTNLGNLTQLTNSSIHLSTTSTTTTTTTAATTTTGAGEVLLGNAIAIDSPGIKNVKIGPKDEGKVSLESVVKAIVVNSSTDDNKENSSGGGSLVVACSSLSSGTNTTNSGQHHVQPYPSICREDKRPETVRKAEEDKRARWKKEEFEMLLKRDQQCVTQPDYEIPFTSKRDAVERLMKYHILRDKNDMNFEEFDDEFGEKSAVLLDKFSGMLAKYRSLLLKESMKEVGCAERVMLERMFVTEEKAKLEQDRILVNQGEVLELPPPPRNWVPQINEMVDKEMIEMEQNSYVCMQVQSAIDSIIGFGNIDSTNGFDDGDMKIEYDAFGVPINNNNGGFNGLSASSADIDEAVRSILS